MAREHQVGIRLTTEEKAKWEAIAKNSGLTLSAYVKRCVEQQEIADKRFTALQGISNVVKSRREFDRKFEKGGELNGEISAHILAEKVNAKLNDVVFQMVEVLEKEGIIPREKSSVKRKKK